MTPKSRIIPDIKRAKNDNGGLLTKKVTSDQVNIADINAALKAST